MIYQVIFYIHIYLFLSTTVIAVISKYSIIYLVQIMYYPYYLFILSEVMLEKVQALFKINEQKFLVLVLA